MTSNNGTGVASATPVLTELEERIRTLTQKADQSALADALEIGALLLEAKPLVPRGQWETWVKDTIGMPRVTAARDMRFARNVQALVHCKSVTEADRFLRQPGKPKQESATKRKPKESGRHLRGLYTKRKLDPGKLLEARVALMKVVGVLEGINLVEYDIGDADEDTIADLHQELTIAATWVDQSLAVVAGYMGDAKIHERIRKLREDTNGRSPAEAATALRLADKLERKLHQASIAS